MLWICLALLTAAVVLALARPFMVSGPEADADVAAPQAPDLAVYRDQLTEIENDRERGLIGRDEAEAARLEVARRLLHVKSTRDVAELQPLATGATPRVLQAVLAAIPVAAMGLYLWVGSPQLPGQPLTARQAAPTAATPVDDLVARVESELKKNPNDVRGWTVIAPVYMRLKRYDDAAYAFSQIMLLKGEAIEPLLGFAEAALLANKGIVNDGIKRAAERAIVLQPSRIEPKIWLALGQEQEGDTAGAIAAYKALVNSAPADAQWLEPVKQQLQRLEGGSVAMPSSAGAAGPKAGAAAPTADAAAPTADAVAALPPAEQQKQIAAMVDGLAARLKQNGNDLPGWQRLLRAYQVMGRKDEAVAALVLARKQFAAEPKALSELNNLALSLGL